jgi:hypothetical protein
MGAAFYDVLQQQYEALNKLYDKNLSMVKQLQTTVLHDILPDLADEQDWDDTDVNRAIEWLEDTRTFAAFSNQTC